MADVPHGTRSRFGPPSGLGQGAGRHRRIEDSDSDSDADTATAQVVLTAAKASDLCPKPFRLIAREGGFTQLENIAALAALDYVDISDNSLTSLEGLAGLPGLKTIVAKGNLLLGAEPLLGLRQLRVLNLAENALTSTDWLLRAEFSGALNALILNGNRIANLDGVAAFSALETLVVSHNEIEDLTPVTRLPRLRKLSASHNRVRTLPKSIVGCTALAEVRVAHNRISQLPEKSALSRLAALRILDVGHNRLMNLDALAILNETLEHLNLAGNPVARSAGGYKEAVLQVCPKLQVLDGTRIAGGRRKVRIRREWKLKESLYDNSDRIEMHDLSKASNDVPSGEVRKRPRTNQTPSKAGSDDDVMDAEQFVAQAKARARARALLT